MKNVRGENDIEAALRRLDRLTSDEGRATAARTLEVVCGLVRHRRVVLNGEKPYLCRFFLLLNVHTLQTQTETIQQPVSRILWVCFKLASDNGRIQV